MRYELLYDLGLQGWHGWPWLLAGAAVMLGAAWRWRRQRVLSASLTAPRFFFVFGAVCLAAGLITLWDHQRLLAALQDGRAQIVEGRLTSHEQQTLTRYDSSSKRWRRSEWEAFRVDGIAFGYTRDAAAVGFRNAAEPPLPLRDGEWMRLHYVEDVEGDFSQRRILRVERGRPVGSG